MPSSPVLPIKDVGRVMHAYGSYYCCMPSSPVLLHIRIYSPDFLALSFTSFNVKMFLHLYIFIATVCRFVHFILKIFINFHRIIHSSVYW